MSTGCRPAKTALLALLATACLLLPSALAPSTGGAESDFDSSVEYSSFVVTFQEPIIMDKGSSKSVVIEGLLQAGAVGEPLLPFKTVKILLPPGRSLAGHEVRTAQPVTLGRVQGIEIGHQPSSLDPSSSPGSASATSVSPSSPALRFPGSQVEFAGIQLLDGLNIAVFRVVPVAYETLSCGVTYFPSITIVLKLLPDASVQLPDVPDLDAISIRIDNPGQVDAYELLHETEEIEGVLGVRGEATQEYVIITSDELRSSFQPLLDWKRTRGAGASDLINLSACLVTVEEIKSNPSYWGNPYSHGGKGNDTQTQVRNFIADAHRTWRTRYVLLGGDDEVIPCRPVWVVGGVASYIPADLYYAGLDGDWDLDGDGVYGEGAGQGGGSSGEEADLFSDVFVGRATVDSVIEVSNFVNKVIQYESQRAKASLNKALMVGNRLDSIPTWGGEYKDALVSQVFPSSDPEIEVTRLYERDGSFSREALIERLEMGTHLVNHMGHGSEESFADLDVRDVEGLDGSDPFFLYTQACDVGGFDSLKSGDEDSIAEHLISAENGAFGVVANSRLGWYSPGDIDGPSQYYDLEFFDAIFDERIRSLGWALADSKEDLVSVVESTGFMRWCCMTLNLLGDPETEIHFIESREHDVAIVGLPSDTPFYGSPCTVKAVVRNLGVVDELAVPVELYADGVLVSVSFCDVPGGSSSEASFLWVPGELRPVLLTARCNLTSDLWRTNNELSSDVAITWRILDSQTVGDTTLTLACHVLVGAGGSLSLRNSTLTFDPIWGRAFDITVEGELMLNDSTIDAFEGFSLTTSNGSRFSAERSSFGDIVGNEGAGGFELQGNSGRIMNCSFVLAGGVVRLSGVSGWVVSNVSVESAASGIQIEESEGVTISGAVVHAAIAGVRVRNCSYISILGCTISGCELGLEIERSEGLRVQGNTITGNALDFGITGSSIVHYLHDIDSNNLTGGRLVYLVEREGIELAASLGEIGCVALISCRNANISGLSLHNNFDGILLVNSSGVRVTGCVLWDNQVGLRAVGSSANSILRNDFFANGIGAWDDGSDFYDASYPSGGNHWDDHTGPDLRSGPNQDLEGPDGIVDTPYGVSGGSCRDRYPFVGRLTDENIPTDADFDFSPSLPFAYDLVQFNDRSSDPDTRIVNWTWDFGDGAFAYYQSSSHIYLIEGNFTVRLTVRDNESVEASASKIIWVRNRPPAALFTYSPPFPGIGETVIFFDSSSDLDGFIDRRIWDFGDGGSSTEQNPTHAFLEKGNFLVTLTVYDDLNQSSAMSKIVPVGNEFPVASFSFDPAEPDTQDTVTFHDSSYDPDGSIALWEWSFGDGSTSTESEPEHRYLDDGFFTVVLVVWDDVGANATYESGIIILNSAPIAEFVWNPESPLSFEEVRFVDLSSDSDGTITEYHWDFGDGGSSALPSPVHLYLDNGLFTVSLTVTDDDGGRNTTRRTVLIGNSMPRAEFDLSILTPFSFEEVSFTDRSSDIDGEVVSWHWDFGDDTLSVDRNPSHRYERPGNYTVVLEIADDDGGVDSASISVLVRNIPPLSLFSWDIESNASASTVIFTNLAADQDGVISSYLWTFGDGASSEQSSPIHSYATEGSYQVVLTVTDDLGNASSISELVTITLPDLELTGEPSMDPEGPRIGQEVTFSALVRNIGSRGIASAEVVLEIDGETIDSVNISLAPSESRQICFIWAAESGQHELRILADAGESITEMSEANNAVILAFSVEDTGSGDIDGGIVIIVLGAIAVTALAAILFLLHMRRKRG